MRLKTIYTLFLILILSFLGLPNGVLGQEVNLVEVSRCLISGCYSAVVAQGDYAFCSTGYGFRILDISDPANPQEVAHIPTDGITSTLSVSGNYLFVCDSKNGLVIYDISDIDNPEITDTMNPPGTIRSVCPYGNYIYAAAENYGIQIIDFSNPYNLELVDIIYIGGEANKVVINDNWLYVTQGIAGLGIYDITNPEEPSYVNYWNTTGGNAKGIYLFPDGDTLAMADFANGVQILGVTPYPWIPTWVATLAIPPYLAGDVSGSEDFGVASYVNWGIQSFSSNGIELDHLELGWSTGALFTYNDYTYVCQGDSGLNIVNCEEPSNMYLTERIVTPGHPSNGVWYNNVAYFASREAGLSVMDMVNPNNPIFVENIFTGFQTMDALVTPDGEFLFAADFYTGINVFHLEDPLHPELVNTIMTSDTGAHALEYRDGYLYVAVYYEGVNVFDVNDPVNPILVEDLTDSIPFFREIGISEDGNHLYGCAPSVGLFIYTIYAPDSIVYEYTLEYFDLPNDIAIKGDYAYIADMEDGLYCIDISNYAYIFKVDSIPAEDAVSCVKVIGDNLLAIGDWTAGVKVVNISDPLNLEVADQFETPGLVFNNFTDGNNLYVCDYYDVLILNLYGNGVEKDNSSRVMLESSNLIGAYPNPFNSTTEISYRISQPGRASLKIYDVNGRAVATIFEGSCEPGEYKQKFVADNLSSGIYFATLEIGRTNQTEKIMLLK